MSIRSRLSLKSSFVFCLSFHTVMRSQLSCQKCQTTHLVEQLHSERSWREKESEREWKGDVGVQKVRQTDIVSTFLGTKRWEL